MAVLPPPERARAGLHGATTRPPLLGQVGWTFFGNVVYAAFQWGMLIVLTKAVAPASVGQFSLGLAIAVPILMLTNLQLRSIQATHTAEGFQFRDYLGLRVAASSLALLLIAAIAVGVGYRLSTGLAVVGIGFAKCVESIADTVYGHLQSLERMNRIAISMILKGGLSLLAFGIVVLATRDVFLGATAMALASLATLFFYDIPSARSTLRQTNSPELSVAPRFDRNKLIAISRLGLPLGAASLLLALASNVPRYFLERWNGEAALGYFAALAYPTAAFSILMSAFGQAATPRLAEYHRNNPAAFRRTVFLLATIPVACVALAGLVALGLGSNLLSILYRKDYSQYYGEFLILLASGAIWSLASVLGYAATASRRLNGQAPASFAVCLAAVLLSAALIPLYGVRGACLVSTATGMVSIVTYAWLLLWKPVVSPSPSAVTP